MFLFSDDTNNGCLADYFLDGTELFFPKPKPYILLDTALLIKFLTLGWWHTCEKIDTY